VEPTRRQVLKGLGLGLAVGLTGCAGGFRGVRLRLATGTTAGEYYRLGRALAGVWQERLGLAAAPEVMVTDGSPANVRLLLTGGADVAVSQLDVAADRAGGTSPLRALAAVYNDVVQIVVRAGAPLRTAGDLRGARVAVGTPDSGVAYVAGRVLDAAGLGGPGDVDRRPLDLPRAVKALRAGDVDAFFWVGALPTTTVDELAATLPVRLLDLEPILDGLRARFPVVYTTGTIPAGTYATREAVSTLLVRNVLLVDAGLDAALAEALTGAVFAEPQRLAQATTAARAVDSRSGIFTQPVPLHDGALRWFSTALS
jgi:TRAP transporter TAXI family solute receptor